MSNEQPRKGEDRPTIAAGSGTEELHAMRRREATLRAYQEMRSEVEPLLNRIRETDDINVATDAFIGAVQAVCRHYENSPRPPKEPPWAPDSPAIE